MQEEGSGADRIAKLKEMMERADTLKKRMGKLS